MTKYCKARIFIGAFYTFLAFAFTSPLPAQDADLAALRAGEVVVEKTRLEDSGGSVRVSMYVEAPARAVWDVISNCGHARRYLRGMTHCEVLIDEPDRALTHHVVDPGWTAPQMDYRFETRRQPYRRMDFELVEGNLEQMDGYWRIDPDGTGVVVEHELRIKPKTPAPRWLIRLKLSRDLPAMMACIRALSGGSVSEELRAGDLAACSSNDRVPSN